MRRNLKALGLALLCALALGAVGAQGASAVVEHSFTSTAGTTVLTGTTEPGTKEVFTVTSAKVECEDIVVRATMAGSADHVALYPDFSGASTKCSAGALGLATIHNNGCTYTYDSDTFENPMHFGAGALHANVSLACGHTGSLTITAGGCVIHIEDTHSPNIFVQPESSGRPLHHRVQPRWHWEKRDHI